MNENKSCEKCGATLPATGELAGLCPKCLMRAGIESERTGPRPWEPPPIAELAGEFPQLELIALLGRGGMGAVYQARQPGLDRVVALKILPEEVGEDPAFAERFEREARTLAQLDHPAIVRVHDAGRQGKRYYLLMEFVDGLNLRQLIRAGQIKPTEALSIVSQVCEALQYAHDQGVVHRDIKPENILVDTDGRVKIADFGLAKLIGVSAEAGLLTRSDQALGTMHYIAPEQIRRPLSVDHRADIYSLGVVFYELLTGEVPVGAFPPPSATVAIDVRLDEVVLKSLAREPDLRYQRAGDVRTDVQSVSAGNDAAFAAATAAGSVAASAATSPSSVGQGASARSSSDSEHGGHARHGGHGEHGGHGAHRTRAHAGGSGRSKTPAWAWVLIGCVTIPFLFSVLAGAAFLFLAPKGPFNADARVDALESQYGAPQPVEAGDTQPDAPVRYDFSRLDRIVGMSIGTRPFSAPVLEWRDGGPALSEAVLDAQGLDPQTRARLAVLVSDLHSAYLALEREATRRIEPSDEFMITKHGAFADQSGYLLLEIDAFLEERQALADLFERELESVLEPSTRFAVGVDRIVDDLMPFGEQRVILALARGPGQARIAIELPGLRSSDRIAASLPFPLEHFYTAHGEADSSR